MTERRRIWELGCFGLDAILTTSFDADELINVNRGFSLAYKVPDHPDIKIPHDLIIYGMAHKACHSWNKASEGIEARLNVMHASVIQSLSRANSLDALAACYQAAANDHEDLPGFIWAALTDPRDEFCEHGRFFAQGITTRAMMFWLRNRQSDSGGPGDE